MKKYIVFFIFIILSLFNINCQSLAESEKVVNQFYEFLKSKDYEKIIDLLDKEALNATPKEQWIEAFKGREEYYGSTKSYSRTGFNISTKNNVTSVWMNYTVECEKGTVYEVIRLFQRKDGYKIVWYEYNKDKDKLNKQD